MGNRGKSKKIRWTTTELDELYELAIIQRKSAENLANTSAKGRTTEAIRSKLNKEFGVSSRLRADGLHYLYLDSDVPKRIKQRRIQAMSTKNTVKLEPTQHESSQGDTMSRIELLERKMASYDRIRNMEIMIETEKQLLDCYDEILLGAA